MTPFRPSVDTAYRDFADLLLRRHRLLMEGKNDGEQIDGVEDDLSTLWEGLDDGQRQSLNGMGSDLNWARRAGEAAPMARKAEDVSDADRQALAAAEEAQDAHAVLHWLRSCSPGMRFAELARRREQEYASVGLSQIAEVFGDLIRGGFLSHQGGDTNGSREKHCDRGPGLPI